MPDRLQFIREQFRRFAIRSFSNTKHSLMVGVEKKELETGCRCPPNEVKEKKLGRAQNNLKIIFIRINKPLALNSCNPIEK